jgi:hypothetical protein
MMNVLAAIVLTGVTNCANGTCAIVQPIVVRQQHNNVEQVIVEQRQVVFDDRYFHGDDGYYSVANNIRQERYGEQANQKQKITDDKITEIQKENAELKGKIDTLIGLLKGLPTTPTPPPQPIPAPTPVVPTNPPPVNPTPTPPVTPNPPGNPPAATQLDSGVFAIFNAKCAKCHNQQNAKGNLQLVDTTTNGLFYQDIFNRVEIYDRTNGVGLSARNKTKMPMGGVLTDSEVETIRLWMIEESDRNRKK